MTGIRVSKWSWIVASEIRKFGFDERTWERWYKVYFDDKAKVIPSELTEDFDRGIREYFAVDLAGAVRIAKENE